MRRKRKGFAIREARQTLAEWRRRQGRLQLPIPVEDIADLLYHLALDSTSRLPEGIAGRLYVEQRIIEVRRDDILPRQRFTIAHEIGHYRLHVLAEHLTLDGLGCSTHSTAIDNPERHHLSLLGITTSFRNATPLSSASARRIELEANTFAAELLMPAQMVEDAAAELGCDVALLAEHFGVSRQAMRYRLVKLFLIPPPGPQTTFL